MAFLAYCRVLDLPILNLEVMTLAPEPIISSKILLKLPTCFVLPKFVSLLPKAFEDIK